MHSTVMNFNKQCDWQHLKLEVNFYLDRIAHTIYIITVVKLHLFFIFRILHEKKPVLDNCIHHNMHSDGGFITLIQLYPLVLQPD